VDAEVVRYNERYKALGTFSDNGALALFVASFAQFFSADRSNFLVALGILLGLAFLFGAWHIRGLIQLETE
jgi:hypothetical protein